MKGRALVGALIVLGAIGFAAAPAVPVDAQVIATATPSLPDLVIESMAIEPEVIGACTTGESILGIRVIVANRGGNSSLPFTVDVNGVRQRLGGLGVNQTATLWFRGYSTGLNSATVDVSQEVFERNEANNTSQNLSSGLRLAPTCVPTPTQTSTLTPTPTPAPTFTPTQTPTPTITSTPTPFLTPTATETAAPVNGVGVVVMPAYKRITAGETVLIEVRVTWNPDSLPVTMTQGGADVLSPSGSPQTAWSPSATVQGVGATRLTIGTSNTLEPGAYTVTITATTSLGASSVEIELEVLPTTTQFEAEIERRAEYSSAGPETIPPYRGGDGFYYEARVNALLQWRPEAGTYYHVNTSELLDLSARAGKLLRLPNTVGEEGSGGNWPKARDIRFGWMTDPLIASRFRRSPPGQSGAWDENGAITLYGLPMSRPTQLGPYVVQRFQRAVFRHWVADAPRHPQWKDTVSVIPLHQAALTFLPEIDPIAAAQIARMSRPGGAPAFAGYWEVDGSASNGFANVALLAEDSGTARVAIGNPTNSWLEVTMIGPAGLEGELAPGETTMADWPGLTPMTWILEPDERATFHVHPNVVHESAEVRRASVTNFWVRPSARAAMARVIQAIARVTVPEVGALSGPRLSAFYRAMLDSATRTGSARAGCLVALDGDVNAGDERAFDRNLACVAREPWTGWILAEAAAAIGHGIDPNVIAGRLNADALRRAVAPDPATGWFWWDLQIDGREPGGRVRVSRTGIAAGG